MDLYHLLFVNDLILQGAATSHNYNTIKETLEIFCSILGQKINFKMLQVVFSKYLNNQCV